MQRLILPGRDPSASDLVTVTINGPPDAAGTKRVERVLWHLLDSPSEWDQPAPNVRLVFEWEG